MAKVVKVRCVACDKWMLHDAGAPVTLMRNRYMAHLRTHDGLGARERSFDADVMLALYVSGGEVPR